MDRIETSFGFEREAQSVSGKWPDHVFSRPPEARPVGGECFVPRDAEHREAIGGDLVLYRVLADVFVIARFDPVTEHFVGGRIIDEKEAPDVRSRSNAASVHLDPVEDNWVPTELQRSILAALDGRALTADGLEGEIAVSRSTLYGGDSGGLNELKALGKVKNSRKVGGYYRPDSSPESY